MQITTTAFGYLVWLMPEEQGNDAVAEAISKLKQMGKVAVLVSGRDQASKVISRMLKVGISEE